MSELLQITDAIVHEYLKTKDKNLAKVFEQKTNAVSFLISFSYLFAAHFLTFICIACAHICICIFKYVCICRFIIDDKS